MPLDAQRTTTAAADLMLPAVMQSPKLRAEHKLAWLTLWQWAGCRPTTLTVRYTALAGSLGCSDRSARRWLDALSRAGLVIVTLKQRAELTIMLEDPAELSDLVVVAPSVERQGQLWPATQPAVDNVSATSDAVVPFPTNPAGSAPPPPISSADSAHYTPKVSADSAPCPSVGLSEAQPLQGVQVRAGMQVTGAAKDGPPEIQSIGAICATLHRHQTSTDVPAQEKEPAEGEARRQLNDPLDGQPANSPAVYQYAKTMQVEFYRLGDKGMALSPCVKVGNAIAAGLISREEVSALIDAALSKGMRAGHVGRYWIGAARNMIQERGGEWK